jgi:hypothetical protein
MPTKTQKTNSPAKVAKVAKAIAATAPVTLPAKRVAKITKAQIAKVNKAPAKAPDVVAVPLPGTPKLADSARIVLVKGDYNPRKPVEGKGGDYDTPFKRYQVIIQVAQSKNPTVAAFLKVLPKWRSTLNRAVKDGHIQIASLTMAVAVGGMLYNFPVTV